MNYCPIRSIATSMPVLSRQSSGALQEGVITSVSMVLCKESAGCIRESVNLLASLGVSHVKIGSAAPLGEWTNEPEHFLSKEELFEAFLEYIPHYFEDGKPVSIGMEGFFSCDVPDGKPYALHEYKKGAH